MSVIVKSSIAKQRQKLAEFVHDDVQVKLNSLEVHVLEASLGS